MRFLRLCAVNCEFSEAQQTQTKNLRYNKSQNPRQSDRKVATCVNFNEGMEFHMPKRVSTKQLLIACRMSFDGKSNREIASELGFTEATVSNWRKLEIWKEFETELIDAYKQHALNLENGTPP